MARLESAKTSYRGRLAPTPSGLLHLGHAATFLRAAKRCRDAGGTLILRNEDLDPMRCQQASVGAFVEDLQWLGIHWDEGLGVGGPHEPYNQSERTPLYVEAWKRLLASGLIYPCDKSRRELRENAALAPHEDEEDAEPIYPPAWRPPAGTGSDATHPGEQIWRFRVPEGEVISFHDELAGEQTFTAGVDFGDFLIWRREGMPAYELAVTVDDIAMEITEVVRGADLLKSTARQLLVYRALAAENIPAFAHCPLVRDKEGRRLAKRHDSVSLRDLRKSGMSAQDVRAMALSGVLL